MRELRRQIRNRLYENTPKKEIQAVFHTKLPAVRPQEIFKDTYNFQFIELKGQNEKELEEKIFIAKYKIKLPSEAKIKKALKNL